MKHYSGEPLTYLLLTIHPPARQTDRQGQATSLFQVPTPAYALLIAQHAAKNNQSGFGTRRDVRVVFIVYLAVMRLKQ